MKKILLVIFISNLFGYYSSYGPGEQWSPSVSTVQGYIAFYSISLNDGSVNTSKFGW